MANPVSLTGGMSKPHRRRYRTTNWPMYNRALERRGSMLILIGPAMQWLAEPAGKMGRPAVFSDAAIQLCLSVKVLFKLRQAVGMVGALLKLGGLDWPVPDYSTLCRRQKTLFVQIPYRRAGAPLNLLVDSYRHQVPPATANGTPASTAPRADVNGARSIWPRIQPHRTSGPSSSPPAGRATARPRLLCSTRSRTTSSSVPSRRTGPKIPAGATPPYSTDRLKLSFRSARTVGSRVKIARPLSLEMQSSATFAKKAVLVGNHGVATMPEPGQRRRCGG